MVKKIIISLSLFFTFFIFSSNVNALNSTCANFITSGNDYYLIWNEKKIKIDASLIGSASFSEFDLQMSLMQQKNWYIFENSSTGALKLIITDFGVYGLDSYQNQIRYVQTSSLNHKYIVIDFNTYSGNIINFSSYDYYTNTSYIIYDYGSSRRGRIINTSSGTFSVTSPSNVSSTFDIPTSNTCTTTIQSFTYDITDATDFGKKLTLNFNGYSNDYYVIIQDYISGYYKKLDPLSNFSQFVIDNIPIDNTYTITFYQNNEIVKIATIDIANEIQLNNGNRYLDFNVDTKNKRIVFEFKNTKQNDVCFITIGETEEQLPDCTSQYVYDNNNSILDKNSSLLFTIKNNNNLVYKKGYTLNLYDNLPFFNITSSFDTYNSYQIVKLITENYLDTDVISYSYDNINFITLTTQRINTLNIYNSTDLYFKLERNNNVLATSYIYVNFKQFSNSQIEDITTNISITDFFKNLTSNVDYSFLDNFKNIWLQSKQSKLYLYLILFVIGSLILFLIRSIRKK